MYSFGVRTRALVQLSLILYLVDERLPRCRLICGSTVAGGWRETGQGLVIVRSHMKLLSVADERQLDQSYLPPAATCY